MRRHFLSILILGCALLVAGWQLLALYARRGMEPLQITSADFADVGLDIPGWRSTKLATPHDPLAPTIAAYRLTRSGDATRLLVRLVHGYNMVDCMRIKHYDVGRAEIGENLKPGIGIGEGGIPQTTNNQQRSTLQWWELSKGGESAVWVTAMLAGSDLGYTGKDTRSMSFPRVGTPDAASWNPTGLSWRSLRHPIRNGRQVLRARWNSSRSDIWVFLRLRRAAWVSDKDLTLVVEGDAEHPLPGAEMERVMVGAQRSLRIAREGRTTDGHR